MFLKSVAVFLLSQYLSATDRQEIIISNEKPHKQRGGGHSRGLSNLSGKGKRCVCVCVCTVCYRRGGMSVYQSPAIKGRGKIDTVVG